MDSQGNAPKWLLNFKLRIETKEIFTLPIDEIRDYSLKNHTYLNKCFKKHYNITLSDYINDLRLGYAAEMLLKTDEKIINIFYDCGYENICWANVIFKNKFGLSPREYRKNNKK